jgi:O-antigen/teichoic acid export membrane protein
LQFFRNAVSVFVTSAAMLPVGLLTSIALARLLSVEDLGYYSVTTSLASVLVILTQFGLAPAAIYRIRRVGSSPARVLPAGLVAVIATSVLALVLCALLYESVITRFLAGAPPRVVFLAVASVPLQLVGLFVSGVARGMDRFRYHNGYRLSRSLAILAAILLVLFVLELGLEEMLAASLVLQGVVTLALLVLVVRETGFHWRVDREELTDGARFGIKSYGQSVAGQLHERVALFLIAYVLADPAQVALYAIAVGVIERLRIIPESLGASLFPKVAGLEERDAGAFTAAVSRHSLFLVAGSVVVLGVVAPILIPLLFGEEYRASIEPFRILLLAMALLTIYHVLSRYFAGMARQRINVITQAAAATLNIVLNLWWIPRYGIVGAAWAGLVSYALEALMITFAFVWDSGQRLGSVLFIRAEDFGVYRRRLAQLLERVRGGSQST